MCLIATAIRWPQLEKAGAKPRGISPTPTRRPHRAMGQKPPRHQPASAQCPIYEARTDIGDRGDLPDEAPGADRPWRESADVIGSVDHRGRLGPGRGRAIWRMWFRTPPGGCKLVMAGRESAKPYVAPT